ncbi:arsenate reductase ArsC [Candidatus Korobacter versatilis]|uniref:arsenate reductase ArsC n=1 Tax=Candidatus Korobacter versatilis TaxID=658062 RepID=UPI0005A48EC6|nr:arsenate reductase ArsC [Candidatus Koribacter versatilis]
MKPNVLFLCTGNSCRSQMAEGLLRHLAGDRFDACSAGTNPTAVNSLAIAAMREKGIDISQHRSKNAAEFLGQHFRYIVTVCDQANEHCPIFPGPSIRLHWSFPDPAAATGTEEDRMPVFRVVRDDIEAKIRAFIENLPK